MDFKEALDCFKQSEMIFSDIFIWSMNINVHIPTFVSIYIQKQTFALNQ